MKCKMHRIENGRPTCHVIKYNFYIDNVLEGTSDHVKQLIGVELNADAVRDAKENAKLNRVANAKFFCDDAGRFMVKMAQEGLALDVLMMDPPRSGSDMKFLNSVLTLKPKTIVYVSCNPETLARDAAVLVKGGYTAVKAVPVDMFPYTEHVETVMLFTLN